VFDGGTLEHVFNFPTALKSCLEMIKRGGRFISITPANQFCGHGFYQFSPELYYSALSARNGFNIDRLLFQYRNRWYLVRNPSDVKGRVELQTSEPISLFISAQRVEEKPIFQDWPQQSDYVEYWRKIPSQSDRAVETRKSRKDALVEIVPGLETLQTAWRSFKKRRKCSPFNSNLFTPIRLDEQ
jgi:hypothetical protein